MISDPIADFLVRIKNGYLADKKMVVAPYSKVKENLGKILVRQGFIETIRTELSSDNKKFKNLRVGLKYEDKKPVLTEIKRVSKPGARIYTRKEKIPRVLGGFGTVIISTPRGLMTGREAKRKGLGGEIVCKMW